MVNNVAVISGKTSWVGWRQMTLCCKFCTKKFTYATKRNNFSFTFSFGFLFQPGFANQIKLQIFPFSFLNDLTGLCAFNKRILEMKRMHDTCMYEIIHRSIYGIPIIWFSGGLEKRNYWSRRNGIERKIHPNSSNHFFLCLPTCHIQLVLILLLVSCQRIKCPQFSFSFLFFIFSISNKSFSNF